VSEGVSEGVREGVARCYTKEGVREWRGVTLKRE
jgi:hypothetical protein